MLWTREEKYFASLLIWRQSFKTVQAKSRKKLNLIIIPRKGKFIIGYTNFKPQGQ